MRLITYAVFFSALSISCCLPDDPDTIRKPDAKTERSRPQLRRSAGDGQSTGNRPSKLADGDVDDLADFLWRKIEHRVLHHLRRTEDKLIDHVQAKTSRLNQSITINYLYKVYQYLIEEVEIGKRIGEMRAGEIEKVRKIVMDQGKRIVSLENSVQSLSRAVHNLTRSVHSLDGVLRDGADNGHDLTSPTPPITSPFRIRPQLPADCQEVYQLGGMKYDGDYFIKINPYLSEEPFEVCCKMANNAGWTVIQRRLDGSVDFFRNWEEYKRGFGDPRGELWLGNDHIYELTNQADYMLRIEMVDFDGRHHFAEYDHFRIEDESGDYRIHVHGYHGNAGDSLTPTWSNHDGQLFSTFDRDNDGRFYDNCAEKFRGAWWFRSCFESHLNGLYYRRGEHDHYFRQNGIQWNAVGHHYSLQSVVMMIKPNKRLQHRKDADGEDRHLSNDIQ